MSFSLNMTVTIKFMFLSFFCKLDFKTVTIMITQNDMQNYELHIS